MFSEFTLIRGTDQHTYQWKDHLYSVQLQTVQFSRMYYGMASCLMEDIICRYVAIHIWKIYLMCRQDLEWIRPLAFQCSGYFPLLSLYTAAATIQCVNKSPCLLCTYIDTFFVCVVTWTVVFVWYNGRCGCIYMCMWGVSIYVCVCAPVRDMHVYLYVCMSLSACVCLSLV